ncbi:MAG: fucose isomerase [Candidatus Glassbacteria bacterium]|nr:fucose isomerase [Candidatus Glassbacteria bacterium]
MNNLPEVKVGIVAVSRDCFPGELSLARSRRLLEECGKRGLAVTLCETLVESEADLPAAEKELKDKGINALVIYLGNFGPEGPLSLLGQRFDGPVMLCAAAEESGDGLVQGRGDAYCGMLNASYNCGLRGLNPYIPEYPVGTAAQAARLIEEFIPVARAVLGVAHLKIFAFGPRPQDFFACNAPVEPLFRLGVEVMENSELDLYDLYLQAERHPRVKEVAREMAAELGKGNTYPDLLEKLARYECALTSFYERNLGVCSYGAFACKCWPAFEKYFGFVPCYVNSRLASRGIPVACEVDIYGALSEYLACAASGGPATLLDINNTVPSDMLESAADKVGGYRPTDLFMGFHCGNTPTCCMQDFSLKYQLIMHRMMEPGKEPDITRGTLEGRLRPGEVTIFRLQSTARGELTSYAAEGEILDLDPKSFGGIGVIAISEMARFYRHVLIGRRFPHHTAVAFSHAGKTLFSAVRMLGVGEVCFNLPAGTFYGDENPFA